jgi:hypothetical protein
LSDDDFIRRILLSVDVEDYSSRTDVDQLELQRTLTELLAAAAREAGFDRSEWDIQSAGDGELAVLPAGESEKRVIDNLPEAIARVLAVHNSTARTEMQLRVRLAMHQGLVHKAAGGWAGAGVVAVSRIVDSAAARTALRVCPKANLVFLLSKQLYVELVLQRHTRLSGLDFREIPVHTKKFRDTAWLHVPGQDVHGLPLEADPAPVEAASAPRPEPAASTFHTKVENPHVQGDWVIGIKNNFTA